jgi:ATP-dependent RNA helicase DDX1
MLRKEKYSHRILSGKLSMQERREHLLLFKNNEIQFLICTDVAARGIDVTNLPYVIQMTLSEDIDDYIHRIGRVGRSDTLGLAITIVSPEEEEKVWYHTCSNRNANNTCFNRQLISTGKGCCKWISEKQIIEQIEKKIGLSIPRITDYTTFQLPEQLRLAAKGIQYGEKVNDEFTEGAAGSAASKLYMTDYMKDAIKNLVALELTSQQHYLELSFNTRKCL